MINNISEIVNKIGCKQLKCVFVKSKNCKKISNNYSFDLYTSEFIKKNVIDQEHINNLIKPNVCFFDNGFLNIKLDDALLKGDILNLSKKFDEINDELDLVLDEDDENFLVFYSLNRIIGDIKNYQEYKDENIHFNEMERKLAVLADFCDYLIAHDVFSKACFALAENFYEFDSSIIMKEIPINIYKACGYIFYEFTKGVCS